MAEPTVSVLLPVYNGAPHLEAALDSVFGQTHPRSEVIVVDDGSSDATADILRRHQSRCTVIRSERNEGVAVSINKAMAVATGSFIAMQTSDDVSHRDRLARQVDQLRSRRVDAVSCEPAIIDGDGRPMPSGELQVFSGRAGTYSPRDWFLRLFFNGNFVCASGATFLRSVWDRVGRTNQALLQMQDFDYWLRSAMRGCSLHVDAEPSLSFRWHGRNLSSSSNDKRTRREMTLIYRDLTRAMDDEQIRSAHAVVEDRHVRCPERAPPWLVLPFVLMRHRQSVVRQMGYEGLLKIIEADESLALLEAHTDLNRERAMDILLQGN